MPAAKFENKARHRQLSQLLCARCHALSNGAMIPAVEDVGPRLAREAAAAAAAAAPAAGEQQPVETLELAGKRLLSPEQLRERLRGVASQKCVAVLLVDLLDASGSFLARARDLVGNNPIILVSNAVGGLASAQYHRRCIHLRQSQR